MVGDGDVLVIGQQRIVRAEQGANIGGMMNADIEIGVVADGGGQRLHEVEPVMSGERWALVAWCLGPSFC